MQRNKNTVFYFAFYSSFGLSKIIILLHILNKVKTVKVVQVLNSYTGNRKYINCNNFSHIVATHMQQIGKTDWRLEEKQNNAKFHIFYNICIEIFSRPIAHVSIMAIVNKKETRTDVFIHSSKILFSTNSYISIQSPNSMF